MAKEAVKEKSETNGTLSDRVGTHSNGNQGKEKEKVTETKVIDLEWSVSEVLKYAQDKSVRLVFDHLSFLELPDHILEEMPYETVKSYWIAKTMRDNVKKVTNDAEKVGEVRVQLSPKEGRAERMLQIRKRTGWHGCWKLPENVEYAKQVGYRVVRELSKEQKDKGKDVEPGREEGEIKKVKRSGKDGVPRDELIAMEIPMDVYLAHVEGIGIRSRERFANVKAGFYDKAEQINRRHGGRGKEVIPFDGK